MSEETKLPEVRKPDVILQDGREIFFDFDAVTYKEITGIFDKDEPKEKSDETVAKICGFADLDELYSQKANDVRKCGRRVVKAWLNWQDDPNG